MGEADFAKYCGLMEEIKLRIKVMKYFLAGKRDALFEPTTIESCALQVRKVLELIAFASLVANEKICAAAYSDFAKTWNAEKLLKKLAKINSNFYPKPFVDLPPDGKGPGRPSRYLSVGYLTKKEFVKVYNKCGPIMHAFNPYRKSIDYDYYKKNIPRWVDLIVKLLDSHDIWLVNDTGFYRVHMSEHGDDRVHWYRFEVSMPGDPGASGK